MRYVALLRGINVGGKNLIGMTDLRASFEAAGMQGVATYIQSGNVLFETRGQKGLSKKVEAFLSKDFGIPLTVVVRSHAQMRSVVDDAPKGFGAKPDLHRYDVAFIKEPLTAEAAMRDISLKEGVDEVWAGKRVIYMSRLVARLTQSRLNRVASIPAYKAMTIRNWNTTTKLVSLLDART